MNSEPLFDEFIKALAVDAMRHPEKLRSPKEVWDEEWDDLLGVGRGVRYRLGQ
ncbi:hypothetical protein KJ693_04295 [bacterium]|nr:hypothetical protein [bacterium]MBU1614514.1 hypothetical protein [bacterium]